MDPVEKFRSVALIGSEKLRGRISGRNRQALIEFATQAAVNYYQIPTGQVHVELENVEALTGDIGTYGNPHDRYIAGYEGDFTAEVVES